MKRRIIVATVSFFAAIFTTSKTHCFPQVPGNGEINTETAALDTLALELAADGAKKTNYWTRLFRGHVDRTFEKKSI